MSNILTFTSLHWRDRRLLINIEKIMRIASIGGILVKWSDALPAISATPVSCNLLIHLAHNLLRISSSVPLPLFVSDHLVSLGFMFLPSCRFKLLVFFELLAWHDVNDSVSVELSHLVLYCFSQLGRSSHSPLTSSQWASDSSATSD